MLAAVAVPGPAAAAEQRQDPGIHKQVSGEEFSAQRRYRRYVVRRHFAPRRFAYRSYGPRYYRPYPYAYGGYPYRSYYAPGPFIGIGPFGFGVGF
jgi:hypothetical protein